MTRLFRITENGLAESRRKPLDLESRIEDWVARDLSLVGVDGFVIGRQVATDHGTRIDLLAMDEEGNLIIIELKRDRSPRDIVGQVLDYASWVRHLTTKDVHDLVRATSGRSLQDLYRARYGKAPPETLNASHQMKNKGYLGYGRVTTPKMPASEFALPSGDPLPQRLPAWYLTNDAGDPDLASYVVGVEWIRTFDRDEAKTFSGIFANQNVVCKIYDQQTADFLREQFGLGTEGAAE
ncbi:MAG: DUF91 domain-containing protein [Rhizorhabdus sp.]|uniref:endonuclease NucS domain-containing protein n=1 Tax=Rhizorhabdus sp. TaxID=1968843 RepID=UPI001B4D2A70|nr:endonuclease NucS domain-containing protein [Rhizorhabdus sp.]MBP8232880.1 DUF91 domain-containing protein [Rhizorhabdus sp.]